MGLTTESIGNCADDEDLFNLLAGELTAKLPQGEGADLDQFLAQTQRLPVGLRAMAAIYQLDVSLTLDDLGWHFANWHHRRYCEEQIWALRELEANEAAEIFADAYARVQPWWDKIGQLVADDFEKFVKWYSDSDLEGVMDPLTRRLWDLFETAESQGKRKGLLESWAPYARKYPHKVTQVVKLR